MRTGDVLQVGLARGAGQPVTTAGLRIVARARARRWAHHAWQLVGVSAFELGQAAVFEQQLGQRVVERQFGEHFLIGRWRTGGGFLLHRQAEFAEEDFPQLFRRCQYPRAGRRGRKPGFRASRQRLADFVALPARASPSMRTPVRSICQITGRAAVRSRDRCATGRVGADLRIQHLVDAQGHVRIFGGVLAARSRLQILSKVICLAPLPHRSS